MEHNQVYISVIIPVFNAGQHIEYFYSRLSSVLIKTGRKFEIIFAPPYFIKPEKFDEANLRKVICGDDKRKRIFFYTPLSRGVIAISKKIKYIFNIKTKIEEIYRLPDEKDNLLNNQEMSVEMKENLRNLWYLQ